MLINSNSFCKASQNRASSFARRVHSTKSPASLTSWHFFDKKNLCTYVCVRVVGWAKFYACWNCIRKIDGFSRDGIQSCPKIPHRNSCVWESSILSYLSHFEHECVLFAKRALLCVCANFDSSSSCEFSFFLEVIQLLSRFALSPRLGSARTQQCASNRDSFGWLSEGDRSGDCKTPFERWWRFGWKVLRII